MRVTPGLACCVLLSWIASPSQAQEALKYGSPVTRAIAGGESHIYTLVADAGDLISGTAQLMGAEGTVRFLDGVGEPVVGMKVRAFYLGGMARRVGFVAPTTGRYQVRVAVGGTRPATSTLQLNQQAVATRMRGVVVAPKEVNRSNRIRLLFQDVERGRADAVTEFWREMAGKGPLIETIAGTDDDDTLVTFLWRARFETYNVLVGWPMAAFRGDDYYMSRVLNTDVWYKTIRLHRGSRFTYLLSPNVAQPSDRLFTDQLDPLNPRHFPDRSDAMVDSSSVLDTAGAPDESWARRSPTRLGTVEQASFKSELLKNERDMWVYTPPGYAAASGPYPLLVLFDGYTYVNADWINATPTLDNLINDGRIRPVVVCFLNSVNRNVELGYAGADTLGAAIVRELLPALRAKYSISTVARDLVIGGSSAGGLAAGLIALRHPEAFGNVLSQSGAFRLRPEGGAEPNLIAQMFAAAARAPVRFYLETGLYENVPSAGLPLHEMVLDEGITGGNRHLRDVLIAKGYDVTYRESATAHEAVHWRATLAEALLALLKP